MDLIGDEKQFTKELNELFEVPPDSILHRGYGFMIHEINEAVAGGQEQYAQETSPVCMSSTFIIGRPTVEAQERIRESLTKL